MSLGSNVLNWVCSLQKILMPCMARTSALIAPFQPVLHRALSINETLPNAPKHNETHQNRISCSNKRLPNVPKHYETRQNRSLGSNWVYRVLSLPKIPMDFMPRTCALILPFQPTLHRVSCSNETIQNAPKH